MKSKPKAVREALQLTPTQAGQLLFGHKPKQAYDTWSQWENGTTKPSKPTESFFDLILFLDQCKKDQVPGADKALDLFLESKNLD